MQLLAPNCRNEGLIALENTGLVDQCTRKAWENELAKRKYCEQFAGSTIAGERHILEKILSQCGGELTANKTENILVNTIRAMEASGNSNRLKLDSVRDSNILDFGAGAWSCFSASIVNYANGFKLAAAIEPFHVDPDVAAEGAFLTIRWLLEQPSRFNFSGISVEEMKRRICSLDMTGLSKKIKCMNDGDASLIDLGGVLLANRIDILPPASVDIIFSNSVLEHVVDLPGSMLQQKRVLSPGGVCVHTVDFSDHRTSNLDSAVTDPVQMYYDGVLDSVNGLRPSQIEAVFSGAGFDGCKANVAKVPPEHISYQNMLPHFSQFSVDDLSEMINSYVLAPRL